MPIRIPAPHSLTGTSSGLENETFALFRDTPAPITETVALSRATRASTKQTSASTFRTTAKYSERPRHRRKRCVVILDGRVATCPAREVIRHAGFDNATDDITVLDGDVCIANARLDHRDAQRITDNRAADQPTGDVDFPNAQVVVPNDA